MSATNELNTNALREHREHERETLERVQAEAMRLERLPEGQEPRGSTVLVDGETIPEPRGRLHGKLTVRW
jgi:hypothetical protein